MPSLLGGGKICLVVLSYLLFFSGSTIICYFVWRYLSDDTAFVHIGHELYLYAGLVLCSIAAGFVTLGVLGCVAVWKELRCLLLFNQVVLVVLLLVDTFAIGLGFVYKVNTLDQLRRQDQFWGQIKFLYGHPAETNATRTVDRMQFGKQCCGVFGPGDWQDTFWHARQTLGLNVPVSCCVQSASVNVLNLVPASLVGCQSENGTQQWRHNRGCYPLAPLAEETVVRNANLLICAGIVLAGELLICLVLSVCVCCLLGKAVVVAS